MTKKLQISPALSLPAEAVTQTLVVYGAKGMGKTNFGSVFAEELYAASLRFSVIDPMGVWWGLQHGARRGDPGLEVLILGGVHGDLPIEPTGGEVVADLVADESISVVIDISRRSDGKAWSKGEKVRFVTAYMLRLYERQVEHRRPLMQIIDEAARYAPQGLRSGDVDESKCLGAIAMVCEEGRNLGIGLTLLTQRSARLNKDVAELADVLVAFRTVGPNSVGAITDWLGDHVARERHKEIVEQLRKLPVGSALVISPGWLEFEGVVPVRARETFDSSATPKAGQSLQAPGRATKPDLDKYRERMAETIERAKENDPREQKRRAAELTRRVSELERELGRAQAAVPQAVPETVEVMKPEPYPALDGEAHRGLVELGELFEELSGRIGTAVEGLRQDLRRVYAQQEELTERIAAGPARALVNLRANAPAPHVQPPTPHAPRRTPHAPAAGGAQIKAGARRMLEVLAAHSQLRVTRAQLATLARMKVTGGTFQTYYGTLRREGLMREDNGEVQITDAGMDYLGLDAPPPPATTEELLAQWRPALKAGAAKMLDELVGIYPSTMSRQALADRVGMEVSGGTFQTYLGMLTRNGLVEKDGGALSASKTLFFGR